MSRTVDNVVVASVW